MSKNYYDILGVSKDASETDIKSAFRKISKENHPDLQQGKTEEQKKAAEAKFKEAAEAYETLSNKDKREAYDNQSNGFNFGGSPFGDMFRGHDFSSVFGGNPFGFGDGFFGNSSHKSYDPNAPENGRNVQIRLDISFKESLFGVTKEFDINIEDVCDDCHGSGTEAGHKIERCPTCNGSGMVTRRQGPLMMSTTCPSCHGEGYMNSHPCKKCNGAKRMQVKRHISINIPAGTSNGQKLRIKGKGQSGLNGGVAGDLFVVVFASGSSVFQRNGQDLKVVVHISPIVASIGGTIDVVTPYKTATIKIPEGTQSGKVFRIKGEGVKTTSSSGDLLVQVQIEPIAHVTAQQKKLLEKLQDLMMPSNFPMKQLDDATMQNALK